MYLVGLYIYCKNDTRNFQSQLYNYIPLAECRYFVRVKAGGMCSNRLGFKCQQYQTRQFDVLQTVQYSSQGHNLFPDIAYSYLNNSRLSKYNLDYTKQHDSMMVSEEPERVWKEGFILEEVRKTTG